MQLNLQLKMMRIRPPLKAIEGVGENAAKSIAVIRKEGEFISKEDLRIEQLSFENSC